MPHSCRVFKDRSEENNKEEKKREKTGSKSDEEAPAQDATSPNLAGKCLTLPSKLDIKNIEWDQLDQLLKVRHTPFFLFYLGCIASVARYRLSVGFIAQLSAKCCL